MKIGQVIIINSRDNEYIIKKIDSHFALQTPTKFVDNIALVKTFPNEKKAKEYADKYGIFDFGDVEIVKFSDVTTRIHKDDFHQVVWK